MHDPSLFRASTDTASDTHIHAPQYPNVGIFGATTLLSWLTTYTFPLESSFSNLSKARKIYSRVVDRTLSQGTTTASYFATVHVEATNLLADLCLEKGQRAFIGRVCMDNPETCPDFYVDENPEDAVAKSRASVQHIKSIDPTGNLIGATITPRFAPSCTRDALSGLGALAAEDESLRIQTHISENSGEIAWVKELFPEHETYAAVYDAHKLLTAKTVLAHGVHLSDSEVALVKERGSSVSHCPSSNSSLSSGMCAVRRLLDAGVPVGLGTDVSGGYAASLLEAVRQTVMVSRLVNYTTGEERDKLSFIEALWLATRGGARCLALDAVEGGVGGFDIGRKMDAQEIVLGGVVGEEGEKDVVAKGKVDIFGWEAREDVVAKWVWNGDDRNVNSVFVGGKCSFEQK